MKTSIENSNTHHRRQSMQLLQVLCNAVLTCLLLGLSPMATASENLTDASVEELVKALRPTAPGPLSRSILPRPASVDLQVPFTLGSSTLKPESGRLLHNLSAAMKVLSQEGVRFSIEGHTCALGPTRINDILSERRAQAVQDFLLSQGVRRTAISATHGFGSRYPVPGHSAEDPMNRRVRVVAHATGKKS